MTSSTRGASAPSSRPTSAIIVSSSATSARNGGPPEPSITQPPFKIRSNVMAIVLSLGEFAIDLIGQPLAAPGRRRSPTRRRS